MSNYEEEELIELLGEDFFELTPEDLNEIEPAMTRDDAIARLREANSRVLPPTVRRSPSGNL